MKLRSLQRHELAAIWTIDRSEEHHFIYQVQNDALLRVPAYFSIGGWPPEQREDDTPALEACFERGGAFVGVFDGNQLVEVAVVDTRPLGTEGEQRQLKYLYVSSGYRITPLTAQAGIEGAQRLREQAQIDLVLLDIHLPGPDVDGRLLGTLIRELHPNAQILPFTADRSPEMAADLQALGMDGLVIKPIAPKELADQMRQALQRSAEAVKPLLQGFLANQARRMVQLLEQTTSTRLPAVALLAHDHLVRAGLTHILEDVRQCLPFTLMIQTGAAEALSNELHSGETRLLVCTPSELGAAEEFATMHHVPLLVYTTIDGCASHTRATLERCGRSNQHRRAC